MNTVVIVFETSTFWSGLLCAPSAATNPPTNNHDDIFVQGNKTRTIQEFDGVKWSRLEGEPNIVPSLQVWLTLRTIPVTKRSAV